MILLPLPKLLPFDRWVVPLLALNPDVGQQSDPLERSKNVRLPGRGGGRSFQEESTYQPKETCSVHHHKHQHQHHKHQHQHHNGNTSTSTNTNTYWPKWNFEIWKPTSFADGVWSSRWTAVTDMVWIMWQRVLCYLITRIFVFWGSLGPHVIQHASKNPKNGFRFFSSLGPTCNTCNAL